MAVNEGHIRGKVREQNVIVERYGFSEEKNAIIGTVRVANLAFEKVVQVHYTFDSWNNTRSDLNLIWEGSVGDTDDTDKFGMVIPLPSPEWTGSVELAVKYQVNGRTFWDNNDRENYIVEVTLQDRQL